MTTMRKQFHERLDQLAARFDDMVALVENAMRDATAALFTGDTGVARSVLDGHDELKAQQAAVDEIALDLLAREQPVAGDLRAIVACLRMSVDLRRMGKLAAHVAEIARDRDTHTPVPAPLWEAVRAMSDRALALVAEAARAVSTRDVVVDLALIGRYYERFADHAVDLGRGIGYLTGRNTLDAPTGTR